MPLLMQLEMGISMIRYFPAKGTAGLERCCVRGSRRVPFPPPSTKPTIFCIPFLSAIRAAIDAVATSAGKVAADRSRLRFDLSHLAVLRTDVQANHVLAKTVPRPGVDDVGHEVALPGARLGRRPEAILDFVVNDLFWSPFTAIEGFVGHP